MEETHQEPNYIAIWVALVVLTLLEVGFSYTTGMSKFAMATVLVALAFVKAGLVALWYMHLKFEGWLIYLVCAVPIVLVGVLMGGAATDVGRPSQGFLERMVGSPNPRTEMRNGQLMPVVSPATPERGEKPNG